MAYLLLRKTMVFSESLRKNADFQSVYRKGRSLANRYLVMYILENGTNCNRIGISVSKKVGNSIVRHRTKRLVKEAYRLHEDMFQHGLDIVVVIRQSANKISYWDTKSALLHLGRLHSIINKEETEG